MRAVLICLCPLLLLSGFATSSPAAPAASDNPADFDEVRTLIRAHLAGTSDSDLDRASLDALLTTLRGKVRIVGGGASAQTNSPAITKVTVVEDRIAWLQIGHVSAALPEEIRRQCLSLAATNKLIGVILDLRFTGGDDYAAAAAATDLFVPTQRPLLDWGNGPVKSVEKAEALSWPVAVLVNSETTGAAEALAAVMRESGVGLILGSTTRGAAMTTKDFSLKNGQQLRIATSPVKLGNGEALVAGVKPDIGVTVSPESERAFLEDPYLPPAIGGRTNLTLLATNLTTGATNRVTRRTRPNEADLVRARRDGFSLDSEFPLSRDTEPEKPVLRDPTLARAVDLLKGLAVIRRARP